MWLEQTGWGRNEIRDVAKVQSCRAWKGMARTLNFIINTPGNYCRMESKGSDKTDLNVERITLAAAMNTWEGAGGETVTPN